MAMDSKIDFTFLEINALHKLLSMIKSETYLNADEIDSLALSPFIVSAFQKIHSEYMNHTRHQYKIGKFSTTSSDKTFLDPTHDFQLSEKANVMGWSERLSKLGRARKEYIRKMDRETYCDLFFAPFKASDPQRQVILTKLKELAVENKK